jgi:hypothetical protein
MTRTKTVVVMGVAAALLAAVPQAWAYSVDPYAVDGPQDPLVLPDVCVFHEVGWSPPFPAGQEIVSEWLGETPDIACPQLDDPAIPNQLVSITRTNVGCPQSCPILDKVWYIADPETTITNFDGWIGNAGQTDAEEAFLIDSVGINQPLVWESLVADNIWQPGETWHFILQDYANAAGGPPHQYDSLGIAGASAGWPPSTGSIMVHCVPEPLTVVGLFLGLSGVGAYIRKRARPRS